MYFHRVLSEGDESMLKDGVLQLRYLGVIPKAGYAEYGFATASVYIMSIIEQRCEQY